MSHAITLGGFPMLYPDRAGEFVAWVDRYFDFENAKITEDCPPWMINGRSFSRKNQQYSTSLPIPNYPASPSPRINTLYWPTGATRWARGYFIATTSIKNQILATLSTPKMLSLVLGSGNNVTTKNVWLLPPRQLSGIPANLLVEQVWLMPVVDDRYWWQHRHMEESDFDNTLTWASLVEKIRKAIGVSAISYETISTDYLVPDWVQFARLRDNAAMMLDAVAMSVGRRVVVSGIGAVTLQSAGTAASAAASQWASFGSQYAGGSYAGVG